MYRLIVLAPLCIACGASSAPSAASPSSSATIPTATRSKTPAPGPLDGSVASYVRRALAASPTIAAARQRLAAARSAQTASGSFPEPTIGYGFFASAVETRVGPQRHRLQVRQPLPWPGTLAAETEAAQSSAEAATHGSEAAELELTYRVRELYWQIWLRRELQDIHRRHLQLLESLSASVRTQLEVGKATLAEVSQIDLRVARLKDAIESLGAEERSLAAALLAVCAQPAGQAPTEDDPRLRQPPDADSLTGDGSTDPRERQAIARSRAATRRAEAARLAGRPRLLVGADFIEVGPREGPSDSGKDAFIVSLGMSLPIFRDRYSGREKQALAESRAHLEDARQRSLSRRAEIRAALADIRDSYRRAELHRTTLLPQADTVYQATLGQYRIGGAPFANLLLAEQELVELRIAIAEVRARHEMAWARLELALSRQQGDDR